MKTEGTTLTCCLFMLAACLQAQSVSAQQLLRAAAGAETDSVSSDRLTRLFKINPNAFVYDLDDAITSGLTVENNDTNTIQERVRKYFTAAGIDLSDNGGTGIFFNERTGTLTVQGTIPQLELVEKAMAALGRKPAHVMIEVRLLEATSKVGESRLKMLLPQLQADDFILPSSLPLQISKDSKPALRTAILTQREFASFLRSAEQSEGIDILSTPKTSTISGRQARIAVEEPSETLLDPPMRGGRRMKLNAE